MFRLAKDTTTLRRDDYAGGEFSLFSCRLRVLQFAFNSAENTDQNLKFDISAAFHASLIGAPCFSRG